MTFTIAGSAVGAGISPLMVDLDADALGNIKSLRIDVVLAPNPNTQLAPMTILQLDFPNNAAVLAGGSPPASQVQLKATIIVQ